MNKINAINEMILQFLQGTNDWVSGDILITCAYHNSIGGLRISPVELRQIIKHLRFGGHPIIASPKGYKYTRNPQELQEYIASRKLELESELNILRKMEGKW